VRTVTDEALSAGAWLACHCCGKHFPAQNVIRFHDHPDDGLCLGCLEWLHNRGRHLARRLNPIWPGWQLPVRIRNRITGAR
jgi:hypothetical protein